MENQTEINKSGEKCTSCGGNMFYSPENYALKCKSCGGLRKIETTRNFSKHIYTEDAENREQYTEWRQQNKMFKCTSCGANIVLSKLEISSSCPYCGASYATEESEVAGLKPDAILPFKFSNEEAANLYKLKIRKKFFLPRAFKKSPPVDTIKGIYIPCFAFDEVTFSSYDGKLATDHRHTDSNGRTHTTTTYRHISGQKNMKHENILVETSSHIDQVVFTQIKPYNLQELVEYKNEFIMGYSVENYDQALVSCKKIGDNIIDNIIRNSILSGYSYDRVCYLNVKTQRSEQKYAYYLLPTYKCAYKYKEKDYVTFMNGQTGKIGGKVPRSALKITALVLGIVLGVAGAILLACLL